MPMALDGIRILDIAPTSPGLYCTWLLGDLGAEVITMERYPIGRGGRFSDPTIGGLPASSVLRHRNKKSIIINLKEERGREIYFRLAKTLDVVQEGLRPGVLDRLGVGYEATRQVNPKIVYCSITGYGQTGPYRLLPGHDLNYQSFGGVTWETGYEDGPPVIPGAQLADFSAGGQNAAIGILAALMWASKTGKGQYIDISMFDGVVSWLARAAYHFATGDIIDRGRHRITGGYACYNIYECKDGKFMTLGCLESHFWENVCRALGKEEYIPYEFDDGPVRLEMIKTFKEIFKTKSRDEWSEYFHDKNICYGPVNDLREVFQDPQVIARGMVVENEYESLGKIREMGCPIKMSETPAQIRSAAPRLGQHTDQVLEELGYSSKEISSLHQDMVVEG
jgi:crotonobetainyl-CoA:carnitine CoA-transferase CaiB-like acyl-CoA transferase